MDYRTKSRWTKLVGGFPWIKTFSLFFSDPIHDFLEMIYRDGHK